MAISTNIILLSAKLKATFISVAFKSSDNRNRAFINIDFKNMEKFNMPNDNSVQEKIVNSESEITSADISNEKNIKNAYDQPASQEEISGLREEIEEKVKAFLSDLVLPNKTLSIVK